MTGLSHSHPVPAPLATWQAVARDIKLSHTVFALPFALLGAFLACGWAGRWPTWIEFGLILLCMFFARTAAMTANRFFDARIDAANPRTTGRAVPSGRVSRRAMGGFMLGSSALFFACAAAFWIWRGNPWPLTLAPLVLAVLLVYSLFKRFSWLCHGVLGLALGLSPLAAAIALEPGSLSGSGAAALYLLAGMVLGWVAGFDVIYALQDVQVDRAQGLHSIPARLGETKALWISRGLHLFCSVCLLAAWWLSPLLGSFFLAASLLAIALLALEQAIVWRSKTRHIHLAFFTLNGVISLLLGAAGIADVLRMTSMSLQ